MIKVSVVSVFDGVEFLDFDVEEFHVDKVRRALTRSGSPFLGSEGDDLLGELVASGPDTMTFRLWSGPTVPVAWVIVSVDK
jgi:hypothetical protein